MAKAKKAENNSKPGLKLGFLNLLFILVGADALLLFTPQVGLLSSMFDDRAGYVLALFGLVLTVVGLRGIFRRG